MKIESLIPKAEFDLQGVTWLLHCADGALPKRTAARAREYADLMMHPWERDIDEDVVEVLRRARCESAKAAGLGRTAPRTAGVAASGAMEPGTTADLNRTAEAGSYDPASDITLSQSTSSALTLVARGFHFRSGDEILAPLGEFPSNVWPWKSLADHGVTFREVALWDGQRSGREAAVSTPPTVDAAPEMRIAEAIGPRTVLVTASWVRFQDGLKLDLGLLGRLCREKGVPLVIDGIQGGGTQVPDLTHVSAFACGGQKGLLALSGQGFLWTSRDFRLGLSPVGSWLSVEEGGSFSKSVTDYDRKWLENGHRLEQGSANVIGAAALGESLSMLNETGIDRIGGHVRSLQKILIRELGRCQPFADQNGGRELARLESLVDAGRLGPIVSIHNMGRGQSFISEMAAKMLERRIFVSTREGYLRIAFHAWHDEDDAVAAAAAIA